MKMEEQGVVSEKESWHVDMQRQFYDELSKVRANAAKTVFS
jgi:hypothetical protein